MIKLLLTLSLVAFAQDPRSLDQNSLEQSGKLFTVKLTPKDKKIQIEFVGYKSAEINLNEKTVTLFLLNGTKRELLRLEKRGENSFETSSIDLKDSKHLELKTYLSKEPETFKFRLP